jgi:hypothetical protein
MGTGLDVSCLLLMEKMPLALKRAWDSDRYKALLWMVRIMTGQVPDFGIVEGAGIVKELMQLLESSGSLVTLRCCKASQRY